ncbi:hypothetical protein HPB47_011413 [Ixodes persulcatus]|uniref:Uncharacterized protein n=1 Tax=Ixodes persulcatus TaxID=34615 RepID=A0AC60NWC2_IXOPE|nr:hypothetical protein HPB47_011413 [Ixodes persulcatus]
MGRILWKTLTIPVVTYINEALIYSAAGIKGLDRHQYELGRGNRACALLFQAQTGCLLTQSQKCKLYGDDPTCRLCGEEETIGHEKLPKQRLGTCPGTCKRRRRRCAEGNERHGAPPGDVGETLPQYENLSKAVDFGRVPLLASMRGIKNQCRLKLTANHTTGSRAANGNKVESRIRVGALELTYTSPVQPEAIARSVAADASRFDRLWMPKLSSLLNYSAPDESAFAQWQRAIPRADKQLEKHTSVCELHFHERYVSRHFKHVVNAELVRMDRSRPVLLPGAVPTQFPNLPKYLSKQLPPKRKLPARTECPAPPRKKCVEDVCPPASVDFEEVSSCTVSFQDLALQSCAQDVFIKGVRQLEDMCDDPDLLLRKVDAMKICVGAGRIDEFPFVVGSAKFVISDTTISSLKCQGPLTGSWHQILGVFASKRNVKAVLLSKIIMEAVLLAEKAGLKDSSDTIAYTDVACPSSGTSAVAAVFSHPHATSPNSPSAYTKTYTRLPLQNFPRRVLCPSRSGLMKPTRVRAPSPYPSFIIYIGTAQRWRCTTARSLLLEDERPTRYEDWVHPPPETVQHWGHQNKVPVQQVITNMSTALSQKIQDSRKALRCLGFEDFSSSAQVLLLYKHSQLQNKRRFPGVEDALADYVKKLRADQMPVTTEIVKVKALELARHQGIPRSTFKASRNWITKFMKRKGFSLRRQDWNLPEAA